MIPVVQSWGEGVLAILALAATLIAFERRMARVEAKVELLIKLMGVREGDAS